MGMSKTFFLYFSEFRGRVCFHLSLVGNTHFRYTSQMLGMSGN